MSPHITRPWHLLQLHRTYEIWRPPSSVIRGVRFSSSTDLHTTSASEEDGVVVIGREETGGPTRGDRDRTPRGEDAVTRRADGRREDPRTGGAREREAVERGVRERAEALCMAL